MNIKYKSGLVIQTKLNGRSLYSKDGFKQICRSANKQVIKLNNDKILSDDENKFLKNENNSLKEELLKKDEEIKHFRNGCEYLQNEIKKIYEEKNIFKQREMINNSMNFKESKKFTNYVKQERFHPYSKNIC